MIFICFHAGYLHLPVYIRDSALSLVPANSALDLVINNLESDDRANGLLVDLSRATTPSYSQEQMMAAIRELQNDVSLLCNEQS